VERLEGSNGAVQGYEMSIWEVGAESRTRGHILDARRCSKNLKDWLLYVFTNVGGDMPYLYLEAI